MGATGHCRERKGMRDRFTGTEILLCLSLVLVFAGAQCASLPGKGEGDASLVSRLQDRSWIATEPVRSFGPGRMYEEIDGEAEIFLPYGVLELNAGFFRPAGNETIEVRLELYRFSSPRDAFGAYTQYRFPDQERIRVGTSEAVVSSSSLDFFKGEHFVRIRAASRSATPADLESLGRAVSSILPGTGDPPPETDVLRIPGLVDGSIVFHRRAILGYEVLAPGYEAKYAIPGTSGTLVLIMAEDTGPAPQFQGVLSQFLPGFSGIGKDLFRADLPSGTLWLMFRGGYRIGVEGRMSREQAGEVLSKMAGRLPPS